MMFGLNADISLAIKFLWLGLFFGVISVAVYLVSKILKNNVVIDNILGFIFWLVFGLSYSFLSIWKYNYSICWFGLIIMLAGFIIVKTSVQFSIDYFVKIIYNVFIVRLRKTKNGELQTEKKI